MESKESVSVEFSTHSKLFVTFCESVFIGDTGRYGINRGACVTLSRPPGELAWGTVCVCVCVCIGGGGSNINLKKSFQLEAVLLVGLS